MPIREPGVIVYISGQQLPPPNPPTRLGYAGYVFARNGPFKTRAVLNSVFPSPFEGIVSGYVYNDISFLRTVAPLYGQLLPNLGHKACSAIICYEDNSTSNTVKSLILQPGTQKLKDEIVPMFALPLWLNGAPKKISYYTYEGPISLPSNNIRLHEQTIEISINGGAILRKYIPDILNPTPSVPISNIMEAHAVAHGFIPSTPSSFSFIIWFHSDDDWPNKNNYIYVNYDEDNGKFHIYTYFDYNATPRINAIKIDLVPTSGTPETIIDIPSTTHVITFTSTGVTSLSDPQNIVVRFSAVYFSSVNSTVTTRISDAPSGTPNPYLLDVTVGSDTTRYELSYSPLDTGYYGFIYDNRIEMVAVNNIYDHITGFESHGDVDEVGVAYTGSMVSGYATDIPFFAPQHDFRGHYTRLGSLTTISFPTPLPDEAGATSTNPLKDDNYIYLRKYITRIDAANLYETWINEWNNSVLYNESDVRPIKESPIQADLLSDYGGTISYGFTKFIRGHDKFMFKVLGSGDLTRVRVKDMENYVKYYWKLFDLAGFHYIRHQGCSTTGVTSSALYIKACFDYRYNAIFGINATLSLADADFEFPRLKREELLEQNVNCIVKDRTLFLWYFNNNLTEEVRRDDSPLGEECNARVAIRLTKLLGVYVERYIGQPNNVTTRARITSDLTNFINNFMSSNPSNMQAFRVICDESNNTPEDIANNRLNIRVEARFGKSIKYIVIFERVLASL